MRLRAGLVVLGVLALVSGCVNDSAAPASGEPSGSVTEDPQGTVPVPKFAASSSVLPTNAAEPPDHPELATAPPPATAGPLGPRNLPTPAELGSGWQTFADPGGAEQGFVGNRTWTRRREPHQAAYEALPVGCANPLPDSALPVPRYALQGTYRNGRGGPAQVLVLRFASAAEASSYFDGYQARMSACGAARAATFEGLTVVPLWSVVDGAATIRRYTADESFVEVSVRRDTSVGLLASSTDNPSGDKGWPRIVAPRLSVAIAR